MKKRIICAVLTFIMLMSNNANAVSYASSESLYNKSNKEWQEILDTDINPSTETDPPEIQENVITDGIDNIENISDNAVENSIATEKDYMTGSEIIDSNDTFEGEVYDRFIIKYKQIELNEIRNMIDIDSNGKEGKDFLNDVNEAYISFDIRNHDALDISDSISNPDTLDIPDDSGNIDKPDINMALTKDKLIEAQAILSLEAVEDEIYSLMRDDIVSILSINDKVKFETDIINDDASYKKVLVTTDKLMNLEDINTKFNNSNSLIEYIQPDYELQVSAYDEPVNDDADDQADLPELGELAELTEYEESFIDVGIIDAMSFSKGEYVLAAVLDTGFDTEHTALNENIFINENEIPNDGIDNDGNGYVDDIMGWDFFNKDSTVNDEEYYLDQYHGTNVMGIIAGAENTESQGVAPKSAILPLKIFQGGRAYTSDIIEAIAYAESMNVKIVNCSWGSSNENPALEEAIQNSGMLFVCATGNSLLNIGKHPVYPAAYDFPNVISVASVDGNGKLSRFSNYGPLTVDVAAPGSNIKTATINNSYASVNGTSMAAAAVSGEAALLYAMNGELTAAEIKEIIVNSSNHVTGLEDKIRDGKLINVLHAVRSPYTDNDTILDIPDDPIDESDPWEDNGDPELYGADGYVSYRASMPTARYGLGVVAVNGKIYAIGGQFNTTVYKKVEVYDPKTDTWETKADMGTARSYFGIAAVGTKIYVFGGYNGTTTLNTVEVYDTTTNTWASKTNMPVSLRSLAATEYSGDIYTSGGYNGTAYVNTVYKYSVTANTWTSYGALSSVRGEHSAFAYNGYLYIEGGATTNGLLHTTAEERFSFSSKTSTVTSVNRGIKTNGACQMDGNRVISVYGSRHGLYSNKIVQTLINGTVLRQSVMSALRASFGMAVVDGIAYIIGGRNTSYSFNTVEALESGYSGTGNLPVQEAEFKTAELDGKIYLTAKNLTYEYNPTSKQWTKKANLPDNLYDYPVAGAYGKLYLFGGTVKNASGQITGYSSDILSYNPKTNAWSKVGTCSKQFTAAVYYSGSIYLMSGSRIVDTYNPLTGAFSTITSIPAASSPSATSKIFTMDNQLFVFTNCTGFVEINIYDFAANHWTRKTLSNTTMDFIAPCFGCFYVFSKNNTGDYIRVDKYDYKNNSISYYNSSNIPVSMIYDVRPIDNKLYIFTGSSSSATSIVEYTPSIEEYSDPVAPMWVSKKSLPGGGYYGNTYSITLVNDKIVIYRTYRNVKDDYVYDLHEYDPISDSYRSLPFATDNGITVHDIVGVGNDLYAYAERYDSSSRLFPYYDGICKYDKLSGKWVWKGDIDWYKYSSEIPVGAALVSQGSDIYIIGGYVNRSISQGGGYLFRGAIYNMQTNKIQYIDRAECYRGGHGAVVADGRIYIIGGTDRNGNLLGDNYAYNSLGARTPIPGGRRGFGIASYDKDIYVAAGYDADGATNTIYKYDTKKDEWSEWYPYFESGAGSTLIATNGGIYAFSGFNVKFMPMDSPSSSYKSDNEQLRFGSSLINPSGNLARTFTDMSYKAPGFDVQFSRTYNSRSNKGRFMGASWTFGFEGRLTTVENNTEINMPNGSVINFGINADGTYTAKDSKSKLVKSGTRYVLTTNDQYVYEFNANGFMDLMKDPNGNKITITFSSGRQTITDQANRVTTINYNTNALISNIVDPLGRTVTYDYDTNNRLTKVTDPMGIITTYGYDSDGYLSSVKDNSGNVIESFTYERPLGDSLKVLKTSTDQNGNTKTYTYDRVGGCVTTKDSKERTTSTYFDNSLCKIREIDAEGKETKISYNLDNGINRYGEESSLTDRNGNSTYYDRDANGNVIRIVKPDMTTVEYTYDGKNNVTSMKDENGNMKFYQYDTNSNVTKIAARISGNENYSASANQANFAVSSYTYGTKNSIYGLLLSETDPMSYKTTYDYDSNGYMISKTNPLSKTEKYVYNKIGFLKESIDANNNSTRYYYDKNGLLLKTENPDGGVQRTTYDARRNVIKNVFPNYYVDSSDTTTFTAENVVNAVGGYTGVNCYTNAYNAKNQLSSQTDPLGYATSFTYDVYGNMLTKTLPNGSIYSYDYDVMNREVKSYYQNNAQLLTSTSYGIIDYQDVITGKKYFTATDFAETKSTYDFAGRLIKQVNPDGGIIQNTYYPNGKLKESIDPMNSKTVYVYDALDRLTEQYTPTENKGGVTYYACVKYKYDKSSNLLEETSYINAAPLNQAAGTSVSKTFSYYKDNRLETKSDSDGRKVTYTYDAAGNITKEVTKMTSTESMTKEYTYYNTNKLKETKLTVDKKDLYGQGTSDQTTLISLLTYDLNGNIAASKDANGTIVTFTYDKMDRPLTTSMPGIDENGTSVNITTSVTYDKMGNLLTQKDQRGNTTTNTYNLRGFLTEVTDPLTYAKHFEYDLAGRLTDEVSKQNYVSGQSISNSVRRTYAYDKMDRVTSKTDTYKPYGSSTLKSVRTELNKYDLNGNLLSKTDALSNVTAYDYDLAGRLIKTLDPEGANRKLPYTSITEYNALNQVIKQTDANGVISEFTYDSQNNMLTTKLDGKLISQNAYNFAGNIISQTDANGNTVTREYNLLGLVRKENLPGDASIQAYQTQYLYDSLGQVKSSTDSLSREIFFTYDKQGHMLTKTNKHKDGSPSITELYAYDVKGNLRYSTNGNGNKTTYTYDANDQLKSESITVNGVNHTTSYEYDKDGNKTKETNLLGNSVTYKYDTLGRLAEKVNQLGTIVEKLSYNDLNLQITSTDANSKNTTFAYDRNGRQVSITDQMGYKTQKSYDNVGNTATTTDANGNVTSFSYDSFNRLKIVTNPDESTVSYTYDLNGNMLTQTNGNAHTDTFTYNVRNLPVSSTDAVGHSETYSYQADGLALSKTDRNGVTTSYEYDIFGRLLKENAGGEIVSHTYDDCGNELTMTDSTGTTARTYDALNRVLTKTVPEFGTTTFTYDITAGLSTGYVSEKTATPDGKTTEKICDKAGRLYQVKNNGTVSATYEYNTDGNLKKVTYPNSVTEEYTYYANSTLNTLTNKKGTQILEAFNYSYDKNGNMLQKLDGKGTTAYTYNNVNQLLTILEPSGRTTEYEYDKAGNRTKETIVSSGITSVTTLEYDSRNLLKKNKQANKRRDRGKNLLL